VLMTNHVHLLVTPETETGRFPLWAGMQASAEILLGRRTVMEYCSRRCGRRFMRRVGKGKVR
jgi:REP element-mobilizing transposase RayT